MNYELDIPDDRVAPEDLTSDSLDGLSFAHIQSNDELGAVLNSLGSTNSKLALVLHGERTSVNVFIGIAQNPLTAN